MKICRSIHRRIERRENTVGWFAREKTLLKQSRTRRGDDPQLGQAPILREVVSISLSPSSKYLSLQVVYFHLAV